MTKKALIIGGGIAGPVTAMALQKAGIDSVVYEAYGRTSDGVGAFLTLAHNGLEALRILDLHDLVCDLGVDTPAFRMYNAKGKELVRMSNQARTLDRSDLYTALRDEAVRRGIKIEYGKRLVSFDGSTATFADGSTATGDFVVGADGLRSRVRELIDPKAPRARHIGLLNTGGYARGIKVAGNVGEANFIFGKRAFFGYFIHPSGEVWWFANPPAKTEPTQAELAGVDWRATLIDLYKDDAGPMLDIIAATEKIIPGWNTYDFPTVPQWHNDKMVLVGDAAHATSPSSGQGASMAIEDAIVLAKCLRDFPGTREAFAAFENLRRARVERVVAHGKRSGDGKSPGPVGALIRDLMMPMILRQVEKKNALSWMFDYRIDWAASEKPSRATRGSAAR
jgi:2-polyprenyl-6-methoxyphenol hydroxylase-like FAD-dependent oxidoreductase